MEFTGQCHCGAIGFVFSTERPPSSWSVRSCQCSFCRGHGARCTSDPQGEVSFWQSQPEALARYRFALRTADFLICRTCGVYVAATIATERGSFATLNLNTLATEVEELQSSQPVSYETESKDERVARRETLWTPVQESQQDR